MVTGDGYGRRLWASYVVLVLFISSFVFFIFLVYGDGSGRRLWAYYVVLAIFISSCIFFIFLVFGDGCGRWLRENHPDGYPFLWGMLHLVFGSWNEDGYIGYGCFQK